ncbi:MAG: alpha/beta hydrolase [Bacteroidales bacterium]|nr:alpha/beta hydrolase [Bacteroidales bacterium]
MCKIKIILILSLLLFSSLLRGQSAFYGSWNGDIEAQGEKLTMAFHISKDGAMMDIPAQGLFNFPVELKCENDYFVEIVVPQFGAAYKGTMTMGLIVGQFTQYGMSFPLTMKKGVIEYNRPQRPQPPFEYNIEEVSFRNSQEGHILSGTLVSPKGGDSSTPVVILVSGSGLQDRDETLMQHQPFWVIADYFAKNGIATLRYDDRGVGASTGDNSKATTESYKDDALAGIEYLRSLERFSKIGVLGHSEGGIIAYMLGAQGNVDFILSMAGPLLSGKEISLSQQRTLLSQPGISPTIVDEFCSVAEKIYDYKKDSRSLDKALEGTLVIESGEALLKEIAPDLSAIPEPFYSSLLELASIAQPWMLYFLEYEPMDALRNVVCPSLLLFGGKDIQVPYKENIEKYGEEITAMSNITLLLFEDCNHLFQEAVTGDISEYVMIEQTILPEVLEQMVNWINTNI